MKRHIFLFNLLASLCCMPCSYGQVFCYSEFGLGGGTDHSAKLSLDFIINKNNFFSLSYYSISNNASTTPPDYEPGLTFFGNDLPQQTTSLVCPMYGRVLYMPGKNTRFILKGGLALGRVSTPENFVPLVPQGWFWLGPNYTYNINHEFTAGIILNPSVEIPFGRVFGMSVGLYSILTSQISSTGLEVNFILGKLRNKKKDM